MNPLETRTIGRTGTSVTLLGLGGAPLGGLFEPVPESEAAAVVARAYDLGICFFDTAPLYGHGLSEQRLGRALSAYPRDSFVLSTKTGRILVPLAEGEEFESSYARVLPYRPVFDFSYDGILRSFEASLERLGLDRVDVLYLHDPDEAFEEVMAGAYPALEKLRAEGSVRAIGAGMNQWQMLAQFARQCDFDCFLLAGRYTLLDQSAYHELLPLCVEKNISIIIGGPFNSGILATGAQPGAKFDYRSAPADQVERVRRLEAVCERSGVSLRAAALQFPMAHPAVCSVIPGCRNIDEVEQNLRLSALPIPHDFWEELRQLQLIPADAPVPVS